MDLTTFARSHQELLRQVEETRESLLVTRRGRPMVEIVPAPLDDDQLRTRLRGQVKSMGDVVSPIDEHWDAS
ncbi:type II toxin-antitoxin system Phd/YefM family antitoxin [Myxococcota bacterium]|nr:type II toxin-antitoxin system Phd/YefM family antitoxin [Myxococcota bacterium]